MYVYGGYLSFDLNEVFLYEECPKRYLENEINYILSQYLHVGVLHVKTEWLYDREFQRGKGAILKKVIIEEDDIFENQKWKPQYNVRELLEDFEIHEALLKILVLHGFKDKFIDKVPCNK